MTIAQRIRSIVAPMPEDSSVTLTVRALREWLAEEQPMESPDYRVEQFRTLFFPDASLAALRDWCALGLFPHAYKRRERIWMVPHCCAAEFKEAERNREPSSEPAQAVDTPATAARSGTRRRRSASARRTPRVRPNTSAWRDL